MFSFTIEKPISSTINCRAILYEATSHIFSKDATFTQEEVKTVFEALLSHERESREFYPSKKNANQNSLTYRINHLSDFIEKRESYAGLYLGRLVEEYELSVTKQSLNDGFVEFIGDNFLGTDLHPKLIFAQQKLIQEFIDEHAIKNAIRYQMSSS